MASFAAAFIGTLTGCPSVSGQFRGGVRWHVAGAAVHRECAGQDG